MFIGKGEIQAKVWYSKKETMPLNQVINEETGNSKNAYGININNLKINFPKSLPNFKNYDTINENKKLKIFSNFYFPIEFCKTTYKELEKKKVTYTVEEAKEMLQEKLEEELKKEISNVDNIVNTQINCKEENQTVTVEVVYEVLENIGTNEKIVF